MLFLIFSIGPKNYAISSQNIIEIIPNLIIPGQGTTNEPLYFAGLICYHGDHIPVLDLCLLLGNTACPKLLSSRIILIQPPQSSNFMGPIGLLAEEITETIKIVVQKNDGLDNPQFRALIESKLSRQDKVIKIFNIEKVLPDNLYEVLNLS